MGGGGDTLGELRTEVPKSSMRSSNLGSVWDRGWWWRVFFHQDYGILCDFDNKNLLNWVSSGITDRLSHTVCVEILKKD